MDTHPFNAVAALVAERVTASVPGTTSYRDAVARAVADALDDAFTDAELTGAFADALDGLLDND